MKIIITEEQYDRAVNQRSLFWIKRRFDSVKEIVDDTTTFLRMLGLHGVNSTKLANSVFIEAIES